MISAPLPRTLVTLATYNEIENLPRLVDAIFSEAPGVDLLVIDDNSPDGTGDWAAEQAERDDRLKCYIREGKQGLGTAIMAGMQRAIDDDYDYVLNLDADFSHPPEAIPRLIDAMADCDVAIGSRYVEGGEIEGWPLHRHLMSRGVNLYARCLLGVPAGDLSGSFRCYRVSLLRQLDFAKIASIGYAFQEEILWHLKNLGARFAEAPITFVDRRYGDSKINAQEAASAMWIIFRLGLTNWVGV